MAHAAFRAEEVSNEAPPVKALHPLNVKEPPNIKMQYLCAKALLRAHGPYTALATTAKPSTTVAASFTATALASTAIGTSVPLGALAAALAAGAVPAAPLTADAAPAAAKPAAAEPSSLTTTLASASLAAASLASAAVNDALTRKSSVARKRKAVDQPTAGIVVPKKTKSGKPLSRARLSNLAAPAPAPKRVAPQRARLVSDNLEAELAMAADEKVQSAEAGVRRQAAAEATAARLEQIRAETTAELQQNGERLAKQHAAADAAAAAAAAVDATAKQLQATKATARELAALKAIIKAFEEAFKVRHGRSPTLLDMVSYAREWHLIERYHQLKSGTAPPSLAGGLARGQALGRRGW